LINALEKAGTSTDPEVRRRAESIVTTIGMKLRDEQLCFTGHTAAVRFVCVLADGKRLLTSGDDKTLRLWDADTGKELRVFEGHKGRVVSAAFSPDGKRILSGSWDMTMRLWDATTGKELHQMNHQDRGRNEVISVAFAPESKARSICYQHATRAS
jgi:WD40 repeat protein